MISDAYAAGFFDGEGSVYVNKRGQKHGGSPSLKVCIANTNEEVLIAHIGRWGGTLYQRLVNKPNHRDQWQWTLSTKQSLPFLKAIQPHVIVKKEVVELGIQYLALMSLPAGERRNYNVPTGTGIRIRPEWAAKRDAIITAIRQVNARGFNAMRVHPA